MRKAVHCMLKDSSSHRSQQDRTMMLPPSPSHHRRPRPSTASIIKPSCCDRPPSHDRHPPSHFGSVATAAQRPRPSSTSLATSTRPPRRSCLAHKSVPRRPQEGRRPTVKPRRLLDRHLVELVFHSKQSPLLENCAPQRACGLAIELVNEKSIRGCSKIPYLTSKRSERRCPV